MSEDKMRLSKLMGHRGLCSRREADALIEQGLVEVNGEVVSELGTKVDPNCKISIIKEGQNQLQEKATVLLYKPIGYVSGPKEDDYGSALDLIQKENIPEELLNQCKVPHKTGLAPAGRLDVDSTGLLVLTADGRVAKALVGENSNIEKEYRVKVEGRIQEGGLELMRHGLFLDGVELRPAVVEWETPNKVIKMILKQGRKRQVRRMCESVGLDVVALKRIRIGNLGLEGLNPNQWRLATQEEINALVGN